MDISERDKIFNGAIGHCDGVLVSYLLEKRLRPPVTDEDKMRARLTEEIVEELRKRLEHEKIK